MAEETTENIDPGEAYSVPEDQRQDHDDVSSVSLEGGADDHDLHLFRSHPGAVIEVDLG